MFPTGGSPSALQMGRPLVFLMFGAWPNKPRPLAELEVSEPGAGQVRLRNFRLEVPKRIDGYKRSKRCAILRNDGRWGRRSCGLKTQVDVLFFVTV